MLYRARLSVFFFSMVLIFYWFLLPFLRTNNEGYTVREFDEDMSKTYFLIGSSSQSRGDFLKAVKSYETALKYRPDDAECLNRLRLCLKEIKIKFKKLANR